MDLMVLLELVVLVDLPNAPPMVITRGKRSVTELSVRLPTLSFNRCEIWSHFACGAK
jgi:hypothetical protein